MKIHSLKTPYLIAIGMMFMLNSTHAMALEAGIGVQITASPTVYFPLRLSESLRLEPYLAYTKTDTTQTSASTLGASQNHGENQLGSIGLGLFKVRNRGDLVWYAGGRLSYDMSLSRMENFDVNMGLIASTTSRSHAIGLSPTWGLEYQVLPRIYLGAEIALRYTKNYGDTQGSTINTMTQTMVRYMF